MSETQERYTGRSYQEGDRVTIVKHDSPLYRQIGTIQQVTGDWYHVLVDGSSFNGWFMVHELTPSSPPPILTQQELLFAQMRGILLHLPDGYRCFIDYWNSFLPPQEEEEEEEEEDEGEEPTIDDGFPMWLEYDDDGQRTPLEHWYNGGEEDFDVPTVAETTYHEMGDPYGEY